MDLDRLSKLLQTLMLEHNRLSLPGMGSFIAELAPSTFIDKGKSLAPPYRKILFRESESWNDGILERAYADEEGIELEVAVEQIASFISTFREELEREKSLLIPNFGTMRATEENHLFFLPDEELFTYKEAYGLKPIAIKQLSKRGRVEHFKEQPERESQKVVEKEKAPKRRPLLKAFIITLVITLLLIALLIIFKEQLKPVWEIILYSKEERELLRLIN